MRSRGDCLQLACSGLSPWGLPVTSHRHLGQLTQGGHGPDVPVGSWCGGTARWPEEWVWVPVSQRICGRPRGVRWQRAPGTPGQRGPV